MSERTIEEIALSMVEAAVKTYRERPERAALRCAYGDAAAFCDAMARQVEQDHRGGRNGKGAVTRAGREKADLLRRCGDKLWSMREIVRFDDEDPGPLPDPGEAPGA